MAITFSWILLAVFGAAALLGGVFQLVGLLRSWRTGIVSMSRWVATIAFVLLAVGVLVFLEYNVRPPVRSVANDRAKPNGSTNGDTSTAGAEHRVSTPATKAAVFPENVTERDSTTPSSTATETTGNTSDVEEYLRATTGFEKQRPPDIDETLKPAEISDLIKQTGHGASDWFLFADGPVKVFCVSGSDNRVTSLLCPKTPCDLNVLPLCHHVRIKNENALEPVRMRIWYYNPFG